MGTVHAKEPTQLDRESNMAERETEMEFDEETHPAMKRANNLLKSKICIDKVHFVGLMKTKNDYVVDKVEDVFEATTFAEAMAFSQQAKQRLEDLDVFSNIEILIDISKGEKSHPNGLDVHFLVEEKRPVSGNVWVQAGNNAEGFMVIGGGINNIAGRGEKFTSKVSYSTLKNVQIQSSFRKPLFGSVNRCLNFGLSRKDEDFPQSSYKDLSKGINTSLDFLTPLGKHEIKWEGLWRELHSVPINGSFRVREESGHSLKSSVKHTLTRDRRDHSLFPTTGHLLKANAEFAGIGGDTQFLRQECELEINKTLIRDIVFSCSLQGGLVKPLGEANVKIHDRFFLGGPLSVRGFQQRGIGPREDGASLGAEAFWAGGLHLYSPLPFRPGQGGFGELFRTHLFATAGNLISPDFENGNWRSQLEQLKENFRWSYGAGITMLLGPAKIEVNYCVPMNVQQTDSASPGIQVGVGLNFL